MKETTNCMRHPFLLFLILVFSPLLQITAQYTDMINTNRPGVSQGAFSVGTNVLQLETGFSLGKEEHRLFNTETDAFTWDYSLRYGLLKEELEISLIGEFQSNTVSFANSSVVAEDKFANFRSNTLGAKYLFYDPYRKRQLQGPNLYSWKANNTFQWADLIPAISIYAGVNFDFEDNPFSPEFEQTISPKFVLSTQNNWIGGWVFVTNIIVDRVTTDFPTYGYIVTLTHSVTDYFSVFLENQGLKSDFYADQLLRGGAAVLISKDLHVDLSGMVNFKDTPSRLYVRVGAAYRFDMHSNDEFIEDKGKAGRNKRRKQANKKDKQKNKRKDGFEDEDDNGDGGL